jgi:hypothetical protein
LGGAGVWAAADVMISAGRTMERMGYLMVTIIIG